MNNPVPGSPRARRLVACAGGRFDERCAQAVRMFFARRMDNPPYLVMSDWLGEDELVQAAVLWVVDSQAGAEVIEEALRAGLPLLVPGDHAALRSLCDTACCGLYYNDAAEAVHCLEYMIRDEGLRFRMGANAHSYYVRLSSANEHSA